MVEFELDGRRVSLATRGHGSNEFRVLVDDAPVPMEVTKTETYTGNLGTRTREVEAAHSADWIRISGDPQEPRAHGPRAAYVYFRQPTGYVYNTSVWRGESLLLTFANDFSSVAILWDESTDVST